MDHRTSQLLYAYWNGVRAGRIAPRRFDIEPSGMSSLLPDTFILECGDGMETRFRLAGTRICETFGREFRGMRFLSFWPDANADAVRDGLARLQQDGACCLLNFDAGTDGATIAFETLLLPLLHTNGAIERILGVMSAFVAPAEMPLAPLTAGPIRRVRLIWPDGRPDRRHGDGHNLARPAHPSAGVGRDAMPPLAPTSGGRLVIANRRRFRVYDGGRGDG